MAEAEAEAQSQPTEAELQQQESAAGHNLFKGLVSLGVLIALVVGLVLAVPGLKGVGRSVAHMNEGWLLLGVALEIVSCLGYVLVFLQVFDRAPIRFGARVALTELAFGVAVSLGGAGSVAIGALIMTSRGAPKTRVAELSAVLFLLTSAINVLTLAAVGLGTWVGILPGSSDPLLTLLPGAVALVVFLFFLVLPRLADRYGHPEKSGALHAFMRETAITVRETRRQLFAPDWRLIGAWLYLWADIGVLAAVFAASGIVPQLSTLVLAYQVGYLANAIPIPGNIGVLDGSIVGMFVLYGVNATHATAATVVYHGIALWVPALWGTLAFLILQRGRGQPLQLRPPRSERQAMRGVRRQLKRAERAHQESS